MNLFFILFIAFVIGFLIQDSCSDLVEGKNAGFICGYGYIHNHYIGCTKCEAGTYNRENNHVAYKGSCSKCPNGTHSGEGSSACLCNNPFINKPDNVDGSECVCPANQYYERSDEKDNCFNCSQYITNSVTESSIYGGDKTSGIGACVCPAGKYYNQKGLYIPRCIKCKAGTYKDTLGLERNCSKCPAGKYSSEGSSSCSDCPPGHVSNEEGSTSCSMCGPGTGPNSSKTACEKCGIGKFSNISTSGACKTFDEMNCSENRRFGGNASGLKDCPPVCEASYTYGGNTSSYDMGKYQNRTVQFKFRYNLPFVDQPQVAYGKQTPGHTVYAGEGGECRKNSDCIPYGNGFKCKGNGHSEKSKCVFDGTLDYDEVQTIYYADYNINDSSNVGRFRYWPNQACNELTPFYKEPGK